MELDVELRGLAQCRLYASYLGDLRADVEMDESQTVVQSVFLQNLECFEQFRTGESELRGVAAALFPFSAAAACQFDAYADVGLHVEFLGSLGDDVDFVEFLHHDEDALAHLLCQQCQFDVTLVFVAVADDE